MRLALVLAAVSLVAMPSAWGKRPKIAVLELTIEGDAPPELRAKMEKSLAGGLYTAGYDVAGRDEVKRKLRGARELEGCTTSTCLARIGTLVGASLFVRGRVESEGASFTVAVELYDAEAVGGLVRRLEKGCDVCTIAEANDLMSVLASQIFIEPTPPKVKLAIASDPPGAVVRVDAGEVGAAPVTVELDPGEHTIRAELPGRIPAEEKVTLDKAAPERQVALSLPPALVVVERAPESRYGAWKWVAVGGGAAALVVGATLIALNGTLTDCPGDGSTCRSEYSTLAPGLVLAGAGLALGGLAVYLIVNDKVHAAAAVVPLPGGAAAVVQGRF